MLHLTIQSPDSISYDGPIKQVSIPTSSWYITILPWHQPLVSVCAIGIVQLVPPEIDNTLLNQYIITNKTIHVSIGQWVLQVLNDHVTILTGAATTKTQTIELLEQNRSELLSQLESLKTQQHSDSYEDILNDIQKIDADIKLSKLT